MKFIHSRESLLVEFPKPLIWAQDSLHVANFHQDPALTIWAVALLSKIIWGASNSSKISYPIKNVLAVDPNQD